MEDSEALIRAYKRKKAELEAMREKFYSTETLLMTTQQEHMLLSEEICNLKAELADSKRTLRELQLKEIERSSA